MKRKILFLIVLLIFCVNVADGHSHTKEEISFFNNIVSYIHTINENLDDKEFCYEQYKEMRSYFINYMARVSYPKGVKNYVSELLMEVKTGIREENISYFNQALEILQSGLKIYISNIYIIN